MKEEKERSSRVANILWVICECITNAMRLLFKHPAHDYLINRFDVCVCFFSFFSSSVDAFSCSIIASHIKFNSILCEKVVSVDHALLFKLCFDFCDTHFGQSRMDY